MSRIIKAVDDFVEGVKRIYHRIAIGDDTVDIPVMAQVDDTGDILVPGQSFGVPSIYTKMTHYGLNFPISQGILNKLKIRPIVLNEHVEESDEIIATVNSSTIVGQNFRTCTDNINTGSFTASSGATLTELDNLQILNYANNAALQAVWVKGGTNEATRELTIITGTSDMSMKLPGGNADGDWLAATTNLPINDSPIDFINGIISFDFYQTFIFSALKFSIYIKDSSTNISTFQIIIDNPNVWQHFDIPIGSFTSGTPADITDIISMGFIVDTAQPDQFGYVDNLKYSASSGSMLMKLWDWGSISPVSGSSKLDDATQYTTLGDLGIGGVLITQINIQLLPGKRLYHIHDLLAGVAFEKSGNSPLIVNNYYALTFHYVDEDVNLYGSSEGLYNSGFSFTTPDTSIAIIETGQNEDLQFYIFSVQPSYIFEWHLHMLDSSGASTNTGIDSEWTSIIENVDLDIEILDQHHHHELQDYIYDLLIHRSVLLNKGSKFEVYYNDDPNDGIVTINMEIYYFYIPPIPCG